jgi:MYXO-CTERM domain-containing protein
MRRTLLLLAAALMLVGRPQTAEASLISGELKYYQATNSIWFTLAGMAELDNSHSDCCPDPHFENVSSWIEATSYYSTEGIPAFHYPDGRTVRGMVARADLTFGSNTELTMKYYLEPDSFYYDWPQHSTGPEDLIGTFYGSYVRVNTLRDDYPPGHPYVISGFEFNLTHGRLADGTLVGTPEPSAWSMASLGLAVLAGVRFRRRKGKVR